jgi:hypothetical protein
MKAILKSHNTIALCLEGIEADHKHVRLDDFMSQLRALRDALSCIDREANGRITLYYRWLTLNIPAQQPW